MRGILSAIVAIIFIVLVGGGVYYAASSKIDQASSKADKRISELEQKLSKEEEEKAAAEAAAAAAAKMVDTSDWKAYKNNTIGFTALLPKDLITEEINNGFINIRTSKISSKAENIVLSISDNTKNSSVAELAFADMAKKLATDLRLGSGANGNVKCDSAKSTSFKSDGGFNALEMTLACTDASASGEKTNFDIPSVYALDISKFAKGGSKILVFSPALPGSKAAQQITADIIKTIANSVVFK